MPAPAPTASIRGRVRTVEFLGARALLRLDVAGQVVSAFVPLDAAVAPGDEVGLAPTARERVRWFDAATGAALG